MESAFNLGKLFGLQFRVHFSWFFIFTLLTVFLARDVFPGAVKGEYSLTYWLMAVATSFLFFVSVLLHEAGHSLAGRASGIPVSGITLFLFGGAAQMTREPASSAAELKMAIAGPVVSLVLAGLFWAVYIFFLGGLNTFAAMGLWLSQINLIVAGFNLLPGFPLDGGRVLRGLWWRFSGDYVRATRVAVFCGRVAGVLIIAAGAYIVFQYRDWLAGVWLAVLGWYLENSARLSLKQFGLQLWMKGKQVADVMETGCPSVEGEASVAELRQRYPNVRCFRVTAPGQPEAAAFLPVPGDKPETMKVAEMSQPLDQALVVQPGDELLSLAQRMNETGKDLAVVKDGAVYKGIVFLDSLIELVNRSTTTAPKAGGRQ